MQLYYFPSGSVSEEDAQLVHSLFPKRFSRAARCVRKEDALCILAAGLLLRRVLGVDESAIKLSAEGRPYIDGGPDFSLSHSGGVCVLAVSEGRVGADIEKLDESNLIAAPVSLTEEELQWIAPAPLERFHTLWTRKESIFKAIGGFSDPRETAALEGEAPAGFLVRSTIWNGSALSVCCEEQDFGLEPIIVL